MSGTVWTRARWWLLAPAAALLLMVVGFPIVRLVALSFCRSELSQGIVLSFAGLDQHARLWQDSRWWLALRNTVIFGACSVTVELALGTAFALLLDRSFRGRRWVRAIVMLPWVLPSAVMALAWAWIFNDSFGVLNDLLSRIGLVRGPVAWLGSPATAMAAMVVADVWKTTPFVALVVLAGLQSIPSSVTEAARVDGASSPRILWHVVLPLVRPACLVALVFRGLQAMGAFDVPYVMTGGGPGGSTETISLYAYRSFYRYLDFGYGAAIAVQGTLVTALALIPIAFLVRRGRPS